MKKTATMLLMISSFLMGTVQAEETAFIDVTGEGKVSAMPDYLTISLTLSATKKTLSEAKDSVDKSFSDLLKKTDNMRIEKKDIDASRISNYPVWSNRSSYSSGSERKITGHTVNRPVTLSLRNLDDYSVFIESIMVDENLSVRNTVMSFDNPESLQVKARRLALLNAKEKAGDMSAVLDQKVEGVISISEAGGPAYQPRVAMYAMEKAASPGSELVIQEQDITAQVQVRFAITEK